VPPVSVSLKSSLVLCEIVQCGTPAPPTITQINKVSVDPVRPVAVSPEGVVVVNGENFNDKNGTYGTLVLIFGDPHVAAHQEFLLQSPQWSDKAAIGQVPKMTGFLDQLASVQIRRSDGVWSAPVTVQFLAARQVMWLSSGNVPGQGIICSNNADQNQCNSWSDFGANGPPVDLIFKGPGNSTLFGVHNSFLGSASGVDQFHISLKNGWIFRNRDKDRVGPLLGWRSCEAANSSVVNAQFTAISPSEFTFSVQWTSTCQFDYGMWLSIEGPIGVPPN